MRGYNAISATIGPASNTRKLITADQSTGDIITQLIKNHYANLPAAKKIAKDFEGATVMETGRNIFDFLKKNIQYKVEPSHQQTAKTVQRFISDGFGDCKHLSNFTGVILHSLGIPFAYRFVSFKAGSKEPTHVYVVAFAGQKEIPIDAVLPFFNTEKPYTFKIDKKMSLYQLSGIPSVGAVDTMHYLGSIDGDDFYISGLTRKLHRTANGSNNPADMAFIPVKQKFGMNRKSISGVETYIGSIGDADFYIAPDGIGKVKLFKKAGNVIKKAVKVVAKPVKVAAKAVTKAATVTAKATKTAAQKTGTALKTATQKTGTALKTAAQKTGGAVKKVAKVAVKVIKKGALAAPRTAFRGLVALNVRGWATGLAKANAANSGQVRSTWEKIGGNYGDLMSAVNSGAKKKRIMGVENYDSLAGYGQIGEPVSTATALSLAIPIIAIMVPLMKRLGGSEDGQGGNATPPTDLLSAGVSLATDLLSSGNSNDNDSSGSQAPSYVYPQPGSGSGSSYDNGNYNSPAGPEGMVMPATENNTTKYLLIGGAALAAVYLFTKK